MNDLTPSFERETGQVIIDGLPAGAAGEALLVPGPGLDLAFDRADGRLCRAVVDAAGSDGSIAIGEQVAATLIGLFGAEAVNVVSGAQGGAPGEGALEARVLSPEPGLARTLSGLARIDAARATSPVPPGSPWWAAEAAELADRAGLPARARAEALQALATLPKQLDSPETLPEEAVQAALAVARIGAADEPEAARQLREAIDSRSGPRLAAPAPGLALDVAAEVESLEKDRVRLTGLHWMLDPDLVPEGLFRLGLSPFSDLVVRPEGAKGRVIVEALLAPGADCGALTRCQVRLVDPAVRRILAQASFTKTERKTESGKPAPVRAELQLPFPLDELPESWIEVVQDKHWPVRSAKGHRIRRALRWADAALRAERAPAALAPHSTGEDWAALASASWERCRHDWKAADDHDRAYLAAVRQAAIDPRTCVPQPPSATAAEIARQTPIAAPAYLAETLGQLNQQGPRDRSPTVAPGPNAKPRAQTPCGAQGSITTITRRFAPEAPEPVRSVAPCPTMISEDSGIEFDSKK
jgi:hypothetical protein